MGLFTGRGTSERRDVTGRDQTRDAAWRSLSTSRKGRLLTEKVANLKGPPALLSPRDTAEGTRGTNGRARQGERVERGRTPDSEQAIMLLRNVYNEIIVNGILRPGWCRGGESFLYYQFYSAEGESSPCADGVPFVGRNNASRVRETAGAYRARVAMARRTIRRRAIMIATVR